MIPFQKKYVFLISLEEQGQKLISIVKIIKNNTEWEGKLVQPLWKTAWTFLKLELPYDPTIPLLGIYQKNNKNTNSKRYMHPNVHSSIIYNSQDIEAT